MINKKPKITINLPSEGDSFLEELENSSLQKDSVILSVQELNDPQALTKRAKAKMARGLSQFNQQSMDHLFDSQESKTITNEVEKSSSYYENMLKHQGGSFSRMDSIERNNRDYTAKKKAVEASNFKLGVANLKKSFQIKKPTSEYVTPLLSPDVTPNLLSVPRERVASATISKQKRVRKKIRLPFKLETDEPPSLQDMLMESEVNASKRSFNIIQNVKLVDDSPEAKVLETDPHITRFSTSYQKIEFLAFKPKTELREASVLMITKKVRKRDSVMKLKKLFVGILGGTNLITSNSPRRIQNQKLARKRKNMSNQSSERKRVSFSVNKMRGGKGGKSKKKQRRSTIKMSGIGVAKSDCMVKFVRVSLSWRSKDEEGILKGKKKDSPPKTDRFSIKKSFFLSRKSDSDEEKSKPKPTKTLKEIRIGEINAFDMIYMEAIDMAYICYEHANKMVLEDFVFDQKISRIVGMDSNLCQYSLSIPFFKHFSAKGKILKKSHDSKDLFIRTDERRVTVFVDVIETFYCTSYVFDCFSEEPHGQLIDFEPYSERSVALITSTGSIFLYEYSRNKSPRQIFPRLEPDKKSSFSSLNSFSPLRTKRKAEQTTEEQVNQFLQAHIEDSSLSEEETRKQPLSLSTEEIPFNIKGQRRGNKFLVCTTCGIQSLQRLFVLGYWEDGPILSVVASIDFRITSFSKIPYSVLSGLGMYTMGDDIENLVVFGVQKRDRGMFMSWSLQGETLVKFKPSFKLHKGELRKLVWTHCDDGGVGKAGFLVYEESGGSFIHFDLHNYMLD